MAERYLKSNGILAVVPFYIADPEFHLNGIARNPESEDKLKKYVYTGAALAEAMAWLHKPKIASEQKRPGITGKVWLRYRYFKVDFPLPD